MRGFTSAILSMACPTKLYFFPFLSQIDKFYLRTKTILWKSIFSPDLCWVVHVTDWEIIHKICLSFVCQQGLEALVREELYLILLFNSSSENFPWGDLWYVLCG